MRFFNKIIISNFAKYLIPMRHITVLLLTVVFLSSCSEYQKVLKSEAIGPKYETAKKLYEKGVETGKSRYLNKATRLFDQIISEYRGKPQGETVSYMNANAYYLNGDYFTSAHLFERFSQSYPTSDKAEDALFKSAKSFYEVSPVYTLDQSKSRKALSKLQIYIDTYTEGEFFEESNALVSELQQKIDRKYYEVAKQYHHTERYKAAIESLDNYILDYPGTKYKEKAYFYKYESAYLLAINSLRVLVEERLEEAKNYGEDYLRYYPEGEFAEEAQTYFDDINKRLKEKAYEN